MAEQQAVESTEQDQSDAEFATFFAEHYAEFFTDLESRRRRYLRSLRNRAIVVALLLAFSSHILTLFYQMMIGLQVDVDQHNLGIMPFVSIILLIVYLAWPLVQYRRRVEHLDYEIRDRVDFLEVGPVSLWNPLVIFPEMVVDGVRRVRWLYHRLLRVAMPRSDALIWQRSELKDVIYYHVFNAFSEFSFRPRGMNSRINLLKPMLIPPHDEYRAEDHLIGPYHDSVLEIAEGQLLAGKGTARRNLFHGVFITIDISELGVKLSRDFQGRTALIDKNRVIAPYIKQRFAEFERYEVADFAPEYRSFTTDMPEAEAVLTERFFAKVQAIAELFESAQVPKKAWDVVLINAITKPFRSQAVGRLADIADGDPLESASQKVECSFHDDKVQIIVPCRHDLFEAPSLFQPALNQAEVALTYGVMVQLGELIDEIYTSKRIYEEAQMRG